MSGVFAPLTAQGLSLHAVLDLAGLPADVQALLKSEGEAIMLAATERMVKTEGDLKTRLQGKGMQFIQVDRAAFANALSGMSKEFPDLAPWVTKIQAVR